MFVNFNKVFFKIFKSFEKLKNCLKFKKIFNIW